MSRIGWVLTALLSVLLVAGWFFLIYSPTSDEIEQVRAETDGVLAQIEIEEARAEQLRRVRMEAPEAESQLAFGRTLVPEDASIPALFRQLQQAADDSGALLSSITPGPPEVVEVDGLSYTAVGVSLSLEATYFQVVDFARRIEDPQLVPRALQWEAAALSPLEYPELTVSLSGRVFAQGIAGLPEQEPEPEPDAAEDGTDDEDDTTDPVEPTDADEADS